MNSTHSVTRQASKANFIPETCHGVSVSRLTPVMSTDSFLIWVDGYAQQAEKYVYTQTGICWSCTKVSCITPALRQPQPCFTKHSGA